MDFRTANPGARLASLHEITWHPRTPASHQHILGTSVSSLACSVDHVRASGNIDYGLLHLSPISDNFKSHAMRSDVRDPSQNLPDPSYDGPRAIVRDSRLPAQSMKPGRLLLASGARKQPHRASALRPHIRPRTICRCVNDNEPRRD